MSRHRRAAATGAVVALVGLAAAVIPSAATLEDSVGLRWLFFARGPIASPPRVTVVSIDETVSARLGLPALLRDWPRTTHARLIDRLVEAGASVIAFDLQFFRSSARAEDDEAFGDSVRRSARTVLLQRIDVPRTAAVEIWEKQDPVPPLAANAAALAPALLPATAVKSWLWLYLADPGGRTIGTLPVVAMNVHAARAGEAVPAAARLQTSGTRAYLNFYGPPGTICTVPYDWVLEGAEHGCRIRDAAVFVGAGVARVTRAGQPDTYETPVAFAFTGVEIQATAFANLADGTTPTRNPATTTAALVIVGGLAGAAAYLVRTRWRRSRAPASARLKAAAAAIAVAAIYAVAAFLAFTEGHILLPVVVPLMIQVPAALILGLIVRPVVMQEQVEAVCLSVDAAGSTALGQRLAHGDYARLLRGYHEALVVPILRHGGEALPPQGDGFVALWSARGMKVQPSMSRAASLAALELVDAADEFNRGQPEDRRLPTRVGLSVGAVTLVADSDRGVFEVFGDPVNLASRLRDLNVQLGTRVLATEQVMRGVSDVPTFGVSADFALKGVARPPRIVALDATSRGLPALHDERPSHV